jgi:hypothetical protein
VLQGLSIIVSGLVEVLFQYGYVDYLLREMNPIIVLQVKGLVHTLGYIDPW